MVATLQTELSQGAGFDLSALSVGDPTSRLAREYLTKIKRLDGEKQRELFRELPIEVKGAARALQTEQHIVSMDEMLDKRTEHISPSEKYTLVVTPFGKGRAAATQGVVYNIDSEEKIATVQRNFGYFPYSFIEGHPNGHDYLVCGFDYQGQTIIELDTGRRRDYLPEEVSDGIGFCWAEHTFDPNTQILAVCGCIWGSGYEYRFYDFSDPLKGIPEILLPNDAYDTGLKPTFNPDGTVTCHEALEDGSKEVVATQTYRRAGIQFELDREWVSEAEQIRRTEQEEGMKRYNEWLEDFRATDPLYLELQKHMEVPPFENAKYFGIGRVYNGWSPHYSADERRFAVRLYEPKSKELIIDLSWAENGPIKLSFWSRGFPEQKIFYSEHSEFAMAEALSFARKLVEKDLEGKLRDTLRNVARDNRGNPRAARRWIDAFYATNKDRFPELTVQAGARFSELFASYGMGHLATKLRKMPLVDPRTLTLKSIDEILFAP